jgi:mannitol-1-phosphate/altronate dehydrogenase
MGQVVFNVAKGHVNELVNRVATDDPSNSEIVVVLLKASQADADLEDYDNLSLLLANAGNTEADFTNYTRKSITTGTVSVDDTNNWAESSIGDVTWTAAGGTTDNSLVKLLVCYDPDSTAGDDTAIVPLTSDDFVATTNGQDLTALEDANGFFRASN